MKINNLHTIEDIKSYSDLFFHTIFADPPYNLSSKVYIDTDGKPKFKQARDFMNKWKFDHEEWEQFGTEASRVLKYGGYCLLFGMDRQLFLIEYYMKKAGFDICQSLHWFFISNFPKSCNVSKLMTKRDNKNISKKYESYRSGIAPLKQMSETIMVFRKPPKQSILDDILSEDPECSPSVLNIDVGRVELNGEIPPSGSAKRIFKNNKYNTEKQYGENKITNSNGRYPTTTFIDQGIADNIDEQSGILKSGAIKKGQSAGTNFTVGDISHNRKNGRPVQPKDIPADSGGASRVMHICGYDEEEYNLLNYFPKVSGRERNDGLENNEANNHPTLKPIELIYRIAQLFKLPIPEQNVYIPFSGVWSEIIGFIKAGYNEDNIYGCELEPEYIEIGWKRLEYWKNKFKEDKQQLNLFEVN